MLRANDTQEDVMSERNKDLVRRYYDQVINGRDLDAVGDYFADERTASGVRKGCFYFFQAFPDLHVSLDEFVAEGDRVFLRSTMTGTHDDEFHGIPATGRHMATDSAEVYRMVDMSGLMRQLTEEPVAARA
jgi:predicted ester cyclase